MKIYISLYFVFFVSWLSAQDMTSALIPMPNQVNMLQGKPFCLVDGKTMIYINRPELEFAAHSLQSVIQERMQITLSSTESIRADIRLLIDPSIKGNEHYLIHVDSRGMTISGATVAAVYYGVKTVDQLLLGDVCTTMQKKDISSID